MILAGVTLKTASGTLDWLFALQDGHVAINPDQIGLVRTTGPEQIIDTNSG